MKPLDDEARALLRAYASAQSPSDERCDRTLERLTERVAAGEPLRPELEHATDVAAPGLGTGAKLLIVLAITAVGAAPFVLGSLGSNAEPPAAASHVERAPAVDDGVVMKAEPELTASSAPTMTSPEPHAREEPPSEPDASAEAAPVRTKPIRAAPPEEPRASLAEELALVDAAMRALHGGEPARAVELLRKHAKSFPHGVLQAEREIAWAEALCAQGKGEAARRRARAFLQAHPRSPLRERAQLVCTADASDASQP